MVPNLKSKLGSSIKNVCYFHIPEIRTERTGHDS